ncbi:SET domain-containing protein [Backusella circina FSU 941]|nr:SET domain-containing protein [Backusella circina FSU 941]
MSSKSKRSRKSKTPQYDNQKYEKWAEDDRIRCACGDNEEDGLMVQCDYCLSWLHSECVLTSDEDIPDLYKCDYCKKSRRTSPPKDSSKAKKRENPLSAENKFTQITQSLVDNRTIIEMYRIILKRWQQYQVSKESVDALQQSQFESYKVMTSNEALRHSIPRVSLRPLLKHLRTTSFSHQRDPSIQKGIFADIHMQENRYLMEIMGKVIEKTKYKRNERNLYSTLLMPVANVFFHRKLDLCVDARAFGNDGRFIRRSCYPNAEIRTILIPNGRDADIVHLGIYTHKEVSRGEEITVPWGWPKSHFISRKRSEFMTQGNTELDEDMKPIVKNMLNVFNVEFRDCACEDKDECYIAFLKDNIKDDESKTRKHQQKHIQSQKFQNEAVTEDKQEQGKAKLVSVPPSPADSVEDPNASSSSSCRLVEVNESALTARLPMKKRWLQRYLRENSSC